MSGNPELQNMSNLTTDNKPKMKVVTRILTTRIQAKIRKVVLNTRDSMIEKHKNVQNLRLKIFSKLKKLQDSLREQSSNESCNRCLNLGTIKAKQRAQRFRQRLDLCYKKFQQIKNNHNELKTICLDIQQNGLKQFEGLKQTKSSDFVDIKKQVLEVYDLYERGKLKLNKLKQIYTQFYDLSLHPCGICLVQPEINKIVILQCGHSICEECFFSYIKSQRIKNQLKNCPFCRQQIEFIEYKQIENQ